MLDEIDFSNSVKIEPKIGSWEKVVLRIAEKQAKRERIRVFGFSAFSIAASLLLIAGALAISITARTPTFSAASDGNTLETISWFNSLGSGDAISTFSTPIDNYYATRE